MTYNTKTNLLCTKIRLYSKHKEDYIFLIDVIIYKNFIEQKSVIKNLFKNTLKFFGLGGRLNNFIFKVVEFDQFGIH